jgi:hypothetical protein
VPLRPRHRQLEGELHDAVGAAAGEDAFLDHGFPLGAFVHDAADAGILALGVLAHHIEVDLAHLAVRQRARHAGHQAHRAQVHVLVELAAELEQRTPQRNVVGHGGRPADGAEEDRFVAADLLLPVLGHHAAVLEVVVAAPVEVVEGQRDAETAGGGLQYAQALGHHFAADAVAGDDGDVRSRHAPELAWGSIPARRKWSTNSRSKRST